MIEQLRSEIENLNQSISNWLGEIDLLNEQIDDARAEIATKEVEIERLQNDETRKAELIEVISNAGLTVEQLEAITDSIRAIDSEAIPIVKKIIKAVKPDNCNQSNNQKKSNFYMEVGEYDKQKINRIM